MLLYLEKGDKKKIWYIGLQEQDNKESNSQFKCYVWKLQLKSSSLVNKFDIVKKFFDEINVLVPGFSTWFVDLLFRYIESGFNSNILLDEKENFHKYSRDYIEAKNIDFNKFVDSKKRSNTSVFVTADELKELAVTSASLKLFGIFSNDSTLKLNENAHREMYNYLRANCNECGIDDKIFNLVKCRTYKSYMSDRFMWDLCKIKYNESPDNYLMVVFCYFLDNLISVLDCEVNPIPFIIRVTDCSIRWLMKPLYKNQTIYGEIYGGMDDIYGTSIGQEAYNVYACNDTIYKASNIGLKLIDEQLNDKEFDQFRERLDKIDFVYPYLKILNLPIISKVLQVPYRQLLSIPPKHIVLLGQFVRELSEDIFKDKFPFLYEMLISVPKDVDEFLNQLISTAISDDLLSNVNGKSYKKKDTIYVTATKSSYKIRNIQLLLNNKETIFGFESKIFKYKLFSSICGIISASKRNLVSVITGKPITKITNSQLECEVINFFSQLYSGKLDSTFEYLTKKADTEYF